NVEIETLPPDARPPRGAFRPLFPEKNLDDWQGETGQCAWGADGLKMEASRNGATAVWSKHKRRDYEVKFQLQFKYPCDFRVFPRVTEYSRTDLPPAGLRLLFVQGKLTAATVPAGETSRRFKLEEFNDVAIRCVGKRVSVRVNGEVVSDEDIPALAA